VTALSFYTFTTYLSTYLQQVAGMSRGNALLVSVLSLLFAALLCPLAGRYSDRVGRRRSMATVCVLIVLTIFPSFWLAQSGQLWLAVLGGMLQALPAVLSGVVTAPLLSSFPTRIRYTAGAISYNLAYTIFGGTAPLMATWLIDVSGSHLAPAFICCWWRCLLWLAACACRKPFMCGWPRCPEPLVVPLFLLGSTCMTTLHQDALVIDGLIIAKWSREVFDDMRRGGLSAANCTVSVWEGFRIPWAISRR
jgi:MFS family permease